MPSPFEQVHFLTRGHLWGVLHSLCLHLATCSLPGERVL